jgi:hypothetical protein
LAHDVFISYSATDQRAANAVCHRLEAAGIRCWIAPRDVGFGKDWGLSIVEAIGEAKLVVVIFSAAANASRHVLDEVRPVLGVQVLLVAPVGRDAVLGAAVHLVGADLDLDALAARLKTLPPSLVASVDYRVDERFGFEVPVEVPGVEPSLLVPRATWRDPAAYDAQAKELAGMFAANFEAFAADAGAAVAGAGPRT